MICPICNKNMDMLVEVKMRIPNCFEHLLNMPAVAELVSVGETSGLSNGRRSVIGG